MFEKFRTISFILYTGILILRCNGEETEDYETVLEEKSTFRNYTDDDFDMENAIQNVESLGLIAEQMTKSYKLIPETDVENFYNYMIQAVDRIQNAIGHSDNIYKFMKANGVLRILSNNLMNTHSLLRTKLLLLLKYIFDVAPTTANVLPLNIVDRLIDIFENDNNLALKAHALDILVEWLPNNPQAQIRVMKISGLETFYKQIDKLDISVVRTLMELLNKILKEHLDAKNDKEQISKDDGEKMRMYQSIGILERMATPKVCNGLLNIFEILWSFNKNENENVKVVLELLTNVKPFCIKFYKKNRKAADLFEALLKYTEHEEEEKKKFLEELVIKVTEAVDDIETYRTEDAKDEF